MDQNQPPASNGAPQGHQPLGRVVATERKPNTPHDFHFWTALDSPVGIGTIVRVEGATPIDGQIPRVYGVVTEGLSYTDLAVAAARRDRARRGAWSRSHRAHGARGDPAVHGGGAPAAA